jgi:hypothetical protein
MSLTETPQELEKRRIALQQLYDKTNKKVALEEKKKDKYERSKQTKLNYYVNNREEILAKKKAYDDKRINDGTYLMPIKCICGASYFYKSKARHMKTRIHQVNVIHNKINSK